jgi:predicted nucleic acid-binding protein
MRRVFADSMYWIALASLHDQWHAAAARVSRTLRGVQIVTTEEVLSEFLAHFCEHGSKIRQGSVRYVESIQTDPGILVREQSHQTFVTGLALYKARPDKGYSLTDCISMEVMRQEGITEVLTHDDHFVQEGFTRLL